MKKQMATKKNAPVLLKKVNSKASGRCGIRFAQYFQPGLKTLFPAENAITKSINPFAITKQLFPLDGELRPFPSPREAGRMGYECSMGVLHQLSEAVGERAG